MVGWTAAHLAARQREHRYVGCTQQLPFFTIARLAQHATKCVTARTRTAKIFVLIFLGPVHAPLALIEAALRFEPREPLVVGEVAHDFLGLGGGDLQTVQPNHSLERL